MYLKLFYIPNAINWNYQLEDNHMNFIWIIMKKDYIYLPNMNYIYYSKYLESFLKEF